MGPSSPVSSQSLITATFRRPARLLRRTTNEVFSIRIIAEDDKLKDFGDRNIKLTPPHVTFMSDLVCRPEPQVKVVIISPWEENTLRSRTFRSNDVVI